MTKLNIDENIGVLKRKDVLKWIDSLTNGLYLKGRNRLVSGDRTQFCCLGVWADQHGCSFRNEGSSNPPEWVPVKGKLVNEDHTTLHGQLSFGLTVQMQNALISKNDNHETWDEVLKFIVTDVLPQAK